jgi:Pyridoxamine 5''-phosphate oxidase.
MKQLDEKTKTLFEAQPLWYVGTCSDKPEISIIGFKEILEDGRLLLCDVFMNSTLSNIKATGNICVICCDPERMEAYEVYGIAEYSTDAEYLGNWSAMAAAMSGGKLKPKGVVLITPERIKVMSANASNGKEL